MSIRSRIRALFSGEEDRAAEVETSEGRASAPEDVVVSSPEAEPCSHPVELRHDIPGGWRCNSCGRQSVEPVAAGLSRRDLFEGSYQLRPLVFNPPGFQRALARLFLGQVK